MEKLLTSGETNGVETFPSDKFPNLFEICQDKNTTVGVIKYVWSLIAFTLGEN
jgi:hypothetical protein